MYRNPMIPKVSEAVLPRVPPPSHRHGAPSGPWPFVDIDDEVDPARISDPTSHLPMSASPCTHAQSPEQDFCWCKYPQALYPNWTPRQQKKSGLSRVIEVDARNAKGVSSALYCLDVMEGDGIFQDRGVREVNERTLDVQWLGIQEGRPPGVKVRALFADGLSGPVLQMLGTRYNIEPFFFTSTLGWIPSRFQSHVVPHESDHITITLTFIKSLPNPSMTSVPPSPNPSVGFLNTVTRGKYKLPDLVIDTQAALPLRSSDRILTHDLLAIHMVRAPGKNTIISLHPSSATSSNHRRTTTAADMHTRMRLTGRSVYWANILRDTTDPTFVLLSVLWYGLYAWDEALEELYNHICYLESQVIITNDFTLTQELHAIRAHLLHYDSLLQDFRNTIAFVRDTPHPGLQSLPVGTPVPGQAASESESESKDDVRARARARVERYRTASESDSDSDSDSDSASASASALPPADEQTQTQTALLEKEHEEDEQKRKQNVLLMHRECGTLLLEVDRLERSRKMMESRLKNVMDLEFSIINIEDSRGMQKLTEATVRDSAAMKQIAYLSMVFLPASFVAAIFGMNVREITGDNTQPETLGHFFAAALPLTLLTIWIVVGYQIQITERRYRVVDELEFEEEPLSSSASMYANGDNENENENGDEKGTGNANANGKGVTHGVRRVHRGLGLGGKAEAEEEDVDDLAFGFGAAPAPASGYSNGVGAHHDVRLRKLKLWDRIWWPALLVSTVMERRRRRRERRRVVVARARAVQSQSQHPRQVPGQRQSQMQNRFERVWVERK